MANYRRLFIPGACYFFTLVTADRRPLLSSDENVEYLRAAFRREMARRPFELQAMVVLPDHLHALWQLPPGDCNYSARWREIKKHVSKSLGFTVWQRAWRLGQN